MPKTEKIPIIGGFLVRRPEEPKKEDPGSVSVFVYYPEKLFDKYFERGEIPAYAVADVIRLGLISDMGMLLQKMGQEDPTHLYLRKSNPFYIPPDYQVKAVELLSNTVQSISNASSLVSRPGDVGRWFERALFIWENLGEQGLLALKVNGVDLPATHEGIESAWEILGFPPPEVEVHNGAMLPDPYARINISLL
ncbi:MAG: hypothetical protein HY426_03175 [Candidatus Levybacteria bacterium]|nr:hypothetical protein [Candidatus Levybacteria bacterium]